VVEDRLKESAVPAAGNSSREHAKHQGDSRHTATSFSMSSGALV